MHAAQNRPAVLLQNSTKKAQNSHNNFKELARCFHTYHVFVQYFLDMVFPLIFQRILDSIWDTSGSHSRRATHPWSRVADLVPSWAHLLYDCDLGLYRSDPRLRSGLRQFPCLSVGPLHHPARPLFASLVPRCVPSAPFDNCDLGPCRSFNYSSPFLLAALAVRKYS